MRKRRKPAPFFDESQSDPSEAPEPEPEPEAESPSEEELEERLLITPSPQAPAVLDPSVYPGLTVSKPPPIYMLWCPECNRVGLLDHGCASDPIVVKYAPAGKEH